MDPSLPTSELIIARVNDGSNLGQPGASGGDMTAFLDLVTTVKTNNNVSNQYWGLNIDDPQQFLWQVDWPTYEQTLQWVNNPLHTTFVTNASSVFNFTAQPPVILYTQWNGEVIPTVEAPITELAFFSLPLNITDAQKKDIIQEEEKLDKSAVSHGKAIAAVTGHTVQTSKGVQQPGEYFRGQFGWNSLEEAEQWRSSSLYKSESSAISTNFQKNGFDLTPAPFPGVNSTTGLFHVNFTISS